MAYLEWEEEFNTGVVEFDKTHQRIVELINRLAEAQETNADPAQVEQILDELLAYTKTHFAAEEGAMRLSGYPDLAAHKTLHDALICELAYLRRIFAEVDSCNEVIMEFMKFWLVGHIVGEDKKYTPYVMKLKE